MRLGLGNAVAISVTATEFWLSNLRAGRCFARGFNTGPLAANFNEIQLMNPVGSGVQAVVRSAFGSSDVNDVLNIRRFDTALVTDQGAGVNLLAGGAAGQCQVRSAQAGALDGT